MIALDFQEVFGKLKIKYKIDEEIKKIHTFLDMRNIDDFTHYMPSPSIKYDFSGASKQFGGNENKLLIFLDKYEHDLNIYYEVDSAIKSVNKADREAFELLYIEYCSIKELIESTKNPFVYEDMLISVLSNFNSYLYSDNILQTYSEMKENFIEEFKNKKTMVKKNFDQLLKKYEVLHNVLEVTKVGSGNYQRKKAALIIVIMYLEGLITINECKRHLSKIHCGRAILKKIID